MHFWQVAMRPGKPLAFGAIEGVPLFGLPGNPVSAMVSFEQFVRPFLLKMQGHKKIFRQTVKAVCAQDLHKKRASNILSVLWLKKIKINMLPVQPAIKAPAF